MRTFCFLVSRLAMASRLSQESAFLQHGVTRCLLHSIAVAYYCDRLAGYLQALRFQRRQLLRGALLHDYFLYDWHDPDPSHRLHGFHHPARALGNALQDFSLDPVEQNIILRHMFPLTPIPPKYREAILVCLVDKGCSLYEVFAAAPTATGGFRQPGPWSSKAPPFLFLDPIIAEKRITICGHRTEFSGFCARFQVLYGV